MIVFIGDDDTLSAVDGNSGWTVELALSGPLGPESHDERAVLTVDLYTIVGPVGDYNVTSIVTSYTPRTAEVVGDVSIVADHLDHSVVSGFSDYHGETVARHRTTTPDLFWDLRGVRQVQV